MEKYGFVYIWIDNKHKRFYVGCHWGYENDSYVCSSRWMRKNYNRRKTDFKRRILSRIYTTRADMFSKEQEWLNLIKKEELGRRYYNVCKDSKRHWSIDPKKRLSVGEQTRLRCLGSKASDATKEKMRQRLKGRVISDETKRKISEKLKGRILNDSQKNALAIRHEAMKGSIPWNKGIQRDEVEAERLRTLTKGLIWIHNGNDRKMIDPSEIIPEGWKRGSGTTHKANLGLIYITNGEINKRIRDINEIPEGWRKGRTMDWKPSDYKKAA